MIRRGEKVGKCERERKKRQVKGNMEIMGYNKWSMEEIKAKLMYKRKYNLIAGGEKHNLVMRVISFSNQDTGRRVHTNFTGKINMDKWSFFNNTCRMYVSPNQGLLIEFVFREVLFWCDCPFSSVKDF
jgi:hypothetical protein